MNLDTKITLKNIYNSQKWLEIVSTYNAEQKLNYEYILNY